MKLSEVIHLIELFLENRPKSATGLYVTSSDIRWGFRTNRDKAPENYIWIDEVIRL